MKIIAVMNEKGGVGKTTITATLGAGLADAGFRVLKLDTDTQGHLCKFWGIEKRPGFFNLLVNGAEYQDVIVPIPHSRYQTPNGKPGGALALVPSDVSTRGVSAVFQNSGYIREALDPLAGFFDYILIDTSPTTTGLQTAIMVAADTVLIPTLCEELAIDGLNETVTHLDAATETRRFYGQPRIMPGGVIPTRFKQRTIEHNRNLEAIQEAHGDLVYPPIMDRTNWAEAVGFGQPIQAIAPATKAAADARRMIKRFMEGERVLA